MLNEISALRGAEQESICPSAIPIVVAIPVQIACQQRRRVRVVPSASDYFTHAFSTTRLPVYGFTSVYNINNTHYYRFVKQFIFILWIYFALQKCKLALQY